ncbi:Indole-3-glycerol phosphate synthase, chloroplastic [Glycine soja]|uniref:Indole-3-glycerol phosphate synthase, chloroplastic n=1 Tax=Glycine soja TaxID=3848 RepID=A0A0B2RRY3_GLYSO|nr:Indole-3-glycerol phosphate synthase, chloroplastic [Glycine soja]
MSSHLRAPMASLWCAAIGMTDNATDYDSVEFWSNPERTGGWLTKQGVHQDLAPSLVCPQARQALLVQGLRRHACISSTRCGPRRHVPHRQRRQRHPQQAQRLRALHALQQDVLHRRLQEGEGGLDQLYGRSRRVESNDGSATVAAPGESVTEKKTPQCDEESSRKCTSDPARDFIGALKAANERTGLPGLIAEVKKVSPSRGILR